MNRAIGDGHFINVYRVSPMGRLEAIHGGIDATVFGSMAGRMQLPDNHLFRILGFASATVRRKIRARERLSMPDSERVVGLASIIGQVQEMVGKDAPADFDAAVWVARWINKPNPALGQRAPAELIDTAQGQAMVSDLLTSMVAGLFW